MRLSFALLLAVTAACSTRGAVPLRANGPGDSAFTDLARQIIDDRLKRHPSVATDLGIHRYDDELEDLSEGAIHAESEALKQFRARLEAIDVDTLSAEKQLDCEQLKRAMDAGVIALDRIRQWTKDPDSYSGAITNAAYVIMKRQYAPAADRLRSLIARENNMPAVLAAARRNLQAPPRIYTQIALEQIDGNVRFFKNDLPAAFTEVTDNTLVEAFRMSNDVVLAALAVHVVEPFSLGVVRLQLIVRNRPCRRDAVVMLNLSEVLLAEPEQGGAVKLCVPAHPVICVRVKVFAVFVFPDLFSLVSSFSVHGA